MLITSCSNEVNLQLREENTLSILFTGFTSCDFDNFLVYFSEKYPSVSLIFLSHDNEHNHNSEHADTSRDQEIIEMVISGKYKADLLVYNSLQAYRYINAGIIEDLANYAVLEAAVNNSELLDGVSNICYHDGFYYGVPIQINYQGYIINKDLFNKFSLPLPEKEWTYDDYYNLAIEASKQDAVQNKLAFLLSSERERFQFINVALGVNVLNGYNFNFNTIEFIDYMKKGYMLFTSGLYYQIDHNVLEPNNVLIDERFLLNTIYYDSLHDYKNKSELFKNQAIIHTPLTIQPGVYTNSLMISIIKDTKNIEMAATLLNEFFNEEYQRQYASEMMLYKDKDRYEIMCMISDNIEEWIIDNTRYALTAIYPDELITWLDANIYDQLSSGAIDFKDCGSIIQNKAMKIYEYLNE